MIGRALTIALAIVAVLLCGGMLMMFDGMIITGS